MKEDIQQRIREVAYLMWESGGKQADIANEYWLRAEREVMATITKAAKIVSPAKKAEPAATPAPAAAAPKPAAPAPAATAPKPAAPAAPAPSAAKPAEAPKPAAKKAPPVLAKKIPTSSS